MSEKLERSKKDGAHALLARMAGSWKGTSKLWFEPDQLAEETPITGTLKLVLDGMHLVHEYEGTTMGKRQTGLAIHSYSLGEQRWQTAWVDSFHNGTRIMFSQGLAGTDVRRPNVLGSYPVSSVDPSADPTGPDWGWRTTLELRADDHLVIAQYNVDPDGMEAKAIEIDYHRI
ncbi:MAG: DUF1579 domain-containing protein [Flavobacteriales bacterium]|nr:DUF1579 domain-containing protein [Flavobacteriales bacterium]